MPTATTTDENDPNAMPAIEFDESELELMTASERAALQNIEANGPSAEDAEAAAAVLAKAGAEETPAPTVDETPKPAADAETDDAKPASIEAKPTVDDEPPKPAEPQASKDDAAGALDTQPLTAIEEMFEPTVQPGREVAVVKSAIQKVASDLDELDEKYDSGEIEKADYKAQKRALNEQRDSLASELRDSEDYGRQFQTQAMRVERAFKVQAKADGFDYDNPIMRAALTAAIRGVEAGSYADLYTKAHAQVVKSLGLKAPAKAAAAPAPAPAPVPQGKPKQDMSKVPPTLSRLPNAGTEGTGAESSPFADLQGLEAEAYFSKMSLDEQRKMMRG